MSRVLAASHPPLRTAQMVVVALGAGASVATIAMAFLRPMVQGPSQVAGVLPIVVVGFGVAQIGAYLVLRKQFLGRAAAMRDEALDLVRDGRVPRPLFQLAITGAALAEGFGLLGAIGVLLGSSWFLLAAPVLAISLILMQVPTRSRLEERLRKVRG